MILLGDIAKSSNIFLIKIIYIASHVPVDEDRDERVDKVAELEAQGFNHEEIREVIIDDAYQDVSRTVRDICLINISRNVMYQVSADTEDEARVIVAETAEAYAKKIYNTVSDLMGVTELEVGWYYHDPDKDELE